MIRPGTAALKRVLAGQVTWRDGGFLDIQRYQVAVLPTLVAADATSGQLLGVLTGPDLVNAWFDRRFPACVLDLLRKAGARVELR